jgi:DNA modification methylase
MELNKIYVENCLHTMQRMQDNFIDVVVTSPPYDGLRDYKGFKFPFKHIARHLTRIIKPGGVIVWVVGDQTINGSETGSSFRQALFFIDCGLRLHDTMIYKKNSLVLNHNRYEQEFEYCFVFSKGRPKTFNPIMIPCTYFNIEPDRTGQKTATHNEKNKRVRSNSNRGKIKDKKIKGNIWEYKTGNNQSTKDAIAFNHPAIFPEALAADHINSWSNEGDLIYDPFGGSGTTGKVAHILKRNWILSEISNDYSTDANTRINTYKTKNLLL